MNISTDNLTTDSTFEPSATKDREPVQPSRNPHEWCCCNCTHVRKGSRVGLVILSLLVCLDMFRVCMDVMAGGSRVHFGVEFSMAVFYLLLCISALTGVSRNRPAYLIPWLITSLILFLALCGISLVLAMHWQLWYRLLNLDTEDVIVIGAVLLVLWAALTMFLYLIWVVFRCYRYLKALPHLPPADSMVRRATLKNGLVVEAAPGEVLDIRSLMPYIAQLHEPHVHLTRRKYSSVVPPAQEWQELPSSFLDDVSVSMVSILPEGDASIIDKSIDKSVDRAIDVPIDKSIDVPIDKSIDRSIDNSIISPADSAVPPADDATNCEEDGFDDVLL